MLVSESQKLFSEQKGHFRQTAICLTDCLFIEVSFDICREIIELINSDKEKPYIRSLLFKFPMLEYFQAKKYVTQEFMIVNEKDDKEGDIKQGNVEEEEDEE